MFDKCCSPIIVVTATARKLANIYYITVLEKVEYKEIGVDYYAKYNGERMKKNLERKAKLLGLKLVPINEIEESNEISKCNASAVNS